MWRKRVGVEPTPEPAKDTGNGFEGHEDHRAPFASAIRARIIAQGFSWLVSPRLVSRPLPLVWFQMLSSPQSLPNPETRAPVQSYRAATLVIQCCSWRRKGCRPLARARTISLFRPSGVIEVVWNRRLH